MNNSLLKQIIRESIDSVLNEEDYKWVDNLDDYITQNNLPMKKASKFQRVNVQKGKKYIEDYYKGKGVTDRRKLGRMIRRKGAPLTTVASDGTQETKNTVTRNHTVLNNVGNKENRWAAETPTFKRKYEKDTEKSGVYKPKGGPMLAAQVNEPISFNAPWNEKMNIDKGGYILQDPNNKNDAYGISGKDFDNTYRFEESLDRIIRESIRRTLS